MREKLIDILGWPSVSLITGRRGSGKTALGCLVLQEAHERGMGAYLMGLPQPKWKLLPEYINPTRNIGEVQDNSAVMLDESFLYLYARDHPKRFNKFISQLIGITRQKNWMLLFISHTLRKLDIGAILDADNLVVRQPSWLHVRYERQEVRELIEPAFKFFKRVSEPVKYAYIYTSKPPIAVKIPLPEFWSEELSKAFSGITVEI